MMEPDGKANADEPVAKLDISHLLKHMVKYGASDLHIKVGRPPLYRIQGKLLASRLPDLTQVQVETLLSTLLTEEQWSELRKQRQIDYSFSLKSGRFRVGIFYQRGALSAVFRGIHTKIPELETLGIPAIIKDLAQKQRGLLLVTGGTGMGKSTTLASLVQFLNHNRHIHILMIEDPIEYQHLDAKGVISQREVGSDVLSINDGLIAGLRQDPDVLVIGEIRDMQTIEAALNAAETGRLVITTLHTGDVKTGIERIVNVFESGIQNQVRMQLSSSLLGILTQQLVIRTDGMGRVPACEVLVRSPAIESHILKNELDRIPAAMENSNTYYGMQTMNQSLAKLVRSGTITEDTAVRSSSSPDDLRLMLSGIHRGDSYD